MDSWCPHNPKFRNQIKSKPSYRYTPPTDKPIKQSNALPNTWTKRSNIKPNHPQQHNHSTEQQNHNNLQDFNELFKLANSKEFQILLLEQSK